jgi:uncharacterized protein YraI
MDSRGKPKAGSKRLGLAAAAILGLVALGAAGWYGLTLLGQADSGQTPRNAQSFQTIGGAVQVRAAPASDARVVATLREGTRLAGWPAATVEGVAWLEVTAIDGTRGFVPASDVQAATGTAQASEVVPGNRRIITSTYVNLRATPSLAGSIVATAEGGTRLMSDGSIESEGEVWLRVPLTADVTGWLLRRFTTADEEGAGGSDEGFDQTGGLVGVAGEATSPVNVQATPSGDARVVRALQPGESVRILGQTMAEGWWYVLRLADGSQGFAPKESIKITGQLGRWEYPDGTPAPGPGIAQGSQPATGGTSAGNGARDSGGFQVQVNPEAAAQADAAEPAPSADPAPPAAEQAPAGPAPPGQ